MPFIFNPSEFADKIDLGLLSGWEKMSVLNLLRYRIDFMEKHTLLLKLTQINHMDETLPFILDVDLLKHLVGQVDLHATSIPHYLVAHYVCMNGPDGDISLAFCVKTKKLSGDYDPIVGDIYDCSFQRISMDDFKKGQDFYLERKKKISDSNFGYFDKDFQGRVHEINISMKSVIMALTKREIEVLFIRDEMGLSVVFILGDFKISNATIDDPDARDHGSGCCPIV